MLTTVMMRVILSFRHDVKLNPADTPDSLAEKIHALEYKHFPRVIEELVVKLPDLSIKGPSRLRTTFFTFSNLSMFSAITGSTGGASTFRGSTGEPFI